jgi:hypothetical protein
MKPNRTILVGAIALGSILTLIEPAKAQVFSYNLNDLVLGFRKTGANQANYEMVVDIGAGTNYVGLPLGSTIAISNYAPAQLTGAVGTSANLNWSVLGNPNSSLPAYPNRTLWLTVPRTDINTKTTTPDRLSSAAQQVTGINIVGIFEGAVAISADLAVSNANNTPYLVREPINDDRNLSKFVAGRFDPAISTLQDTWTPNVESITPTSFSNPVRSDLYEVRPIGPVDPHTGLTNGPAYFVGYFQLNTDGTMTFTRAAASTPLPPAPALTVSLSSNTRTISFLTTNGATYTLFYTNTAGLSQPVTNWPSASTNIIGDNTVRSFTDTTTDDNRLYRVRAQ